MDHSASAVDAAARYRHDGFAIVRAFDRRQRELIEGFAIGWLMGLLGRSCGEPLRARSIATYHHWYAEVGIDHASVLRAANRHTTPPAEVLEALLTERVRTFLDAIGVTDFDLWDEGLGTVGFRLIRPGVGDGYPWTRKSWGVAKDVVSCWIPIVGMGPDQTLNLVPGSHLLDFPSHLPADQKFRRDERRLAMDPAELTTFSPTLSPGEVIFFAPLTLHSEDVARGDCTRFSLEYRVQPRLPPAALPRRPG